MSEEAAKDTAALEAAPEAEEQQQASETQEAATGGEPTIQDLRKQAAEAGIKFGRNASKAEIADMLAQSQQPAEAAPSKPKKTTSKKPDLRPEPESDPGWDMGKEMDSPDSYEALAAEFDQDRMKARTPQEEGDEGEEAAGEGEGEDDQDAADAEAQKAKEAEGQATKDDEGQDDEPKRPDFLLEKYKTVEDQAKAYGEAEKAMHATKGELAEAKKQNETLLADYKQLAEWAEKADQYIRSGANQAPQTPGKGQQAADTGEQDNAGQELSELFGEDFNERMWDSPSEALGPAIKKLLQQAKAEAKAEITAEMEAKGKAQKEQRKVQEFWAGKVKDAETHFNEKYPHLESFGELVVTSVIGLLKGNDQNKRAFAQDPAAFVDRLVGKLPTAQTAGADTAPPPPPTSAPQETRTPLTGSAAMRAGRGTVPPPPRKPSIASPDQVVAAREREHDRLWG